MHAMPAVPGPHGEQTPFGKQVDSGRHCAADVHGALGRPWQMPGVVVVLQT